MQIFFIHLRKLLKQKKWKTDFSVPHRVNNFQQTTEQLLFSGNNGLIYLFLLDNHYHRNTLPNISKQTYFLAYLNSTIFTLTSLCIFNVLESAKITYTSFAFKTLKFILKLMPLMRSPLEKMSSTLTA